jgi:hypothetical protein
MSDKDGGPTHYEGMTLRDYFAAKMLQGFASNPSVFAANQMSGWSLVNCRDEDLCLLAYSFADDMLKARNEIKPMRSDEMVPRAGGR